MSFEHQKSTFPKDRNALQLSHSCHIDFKGFHFFSMSVGALMAQVVSSSSTELFSPGINFRMCLRMFGLLPLRGRVPNREAGRILSHGGDWQLLLLPLLMLMLWVRVRAGRGGAPSGRPSLLKKPKLGSVGLNKSSNTEDIKSSLSSVCALRQLLSLEKRWPHRPFGEERDISESMEGF